jgi:hypothetical protein
MSEINIIELIEKNPITKLSPTYNSKFINKIKEYFDDFEKNLFASSFYCYLNYDKNLDFIIDLDHVWKFLGFTNKANSKILLENVFKENIDYKKSDDLIDPSIKQTNNGNKPQKKGRGGHNVKKIFLTIKCFKSMCLKAGTKKADEIHEYYMKLEDILQEIINEESNELKLQLIQKDNALLQKDNEIIQNKILSEREKEVLREKTLLEQFTENMQCIYIGRIDNTSTIGEKLIKFGHSNNLRLRVEQHKKIYSNFLLLHVFKVSNKIAIEKCIKQHNVLKKYRRNILIENVNYTELLSMDKLTYEELETTILEIIKENEYNIENYNKLLDINKELHTQIYSLNDTITDLNKKLDDAQSQLKNYNPEISYAEKKFRKRTPFIQRNKYNLYIFECRENRYKCGMTREVDIKSVEDIYKATDPNGKMVYTQLVNSPFTEKIMSSILSERLVTLGNNMYEGSIDEIKLLFTIIRNIEEPLINMDLSLINVYELFNNMDKKYTNTLENIDKEEIDPEVPLVRKAKRAIDQINKDNGEIIASFESIQAAANHMGCSDVAIGIALRNHSKCKGYLWRYSGISSEDQYKDQPVIKVCCSTGEKQFFQNIAAAAVNCNISAPGLRNRILTKVHVNDHHWIFNRDTTHYT